jgi:hypothetical protein
MSTLLLNRTDFKNYAREYSNQKHLEYSDSSLKRVWFNTHFQIVFWDSSTTRYFRNAISYSVLDRM